MLKKLAYTIFFIRNKNIYQTTKHGSQLVTLAIVCFLLGN